MKNSSKTKKTLAAFFLALLLACAFAFTLSACGGKKALERIEVTTPPAKVTYVEGEKFNPEGMKLTAYYSDGSDAEVTEYTLRPDANTELDTTYTKVTVFYTEGEITKSADISITVTPEEPPEKTILVAVVTKLPKIEYKEGETFSVAGMEWAITYSDLSTETVKFTAETEGVTFTPSGELKTTDTSVSITYNGYTLATPVPITVTGDELTVSSAAVSKLPSKTKYEAGETFSVEGMEIMVVYSDLSTETIKCTAETEGITFTPSGALKVSDTSVSVTYKGCPLLTPIPITVTAAAEIVDYEILKAPDKTSYFEGETFEIEGLVVNFIYDDGSDKEITFTSETEGVSFDTDAFNKNPNGNPFNYPKVITITYKGYNFNVSVSVEYPAVTELTIKKMPDKTKYMAGEKFNAAGMVITVTWADDYSQDYNWSGFIVYSDTLTADDEEVRVGFFDRFYSRYVYTYVPVQVISITDATLTNGPDKTEYVAGESFDPAGMVLSVTYSDGTSETVNVVRGMEGLILPENALTSSDTSVTVSYYGNEFEINVVILKGVYIEAEDAVINSSKYKTPSDAADKNGVPNASGGKYVSDLEAGDSVVFSFYSDKAGKGDLAFILASKHLIRDIGWTPVEMGDCQFNLICEFSVNGVQYNIADDVILPGGVDEAGGAWLWYNWKEVVFENIDFVQGKNEVVLEFIPHNINDCSQPSFNGTFTANVDSLKVTSEECEVGPYSFNYQVTNVELSERDGKALLVLTGDIGYYNFTEEELQEALKGSVKLGLLNRNYEITRELKINSANVVKSGETVQNGQTLYEGSFEITAVLSDVTYLAEYALTVNGEQLIISVYGDSLTFNQYQYRVDDYDFVRISVSWRYDSNFSFNGITNAKIIEEEGKAVYCLRGEYYSYGFTDDEVKDLLAKEYFDLQQNEYAVSGSWDGSWKNIQFEAIEVTLVGNIFTIKYDISSLDDFCYTTHFQMGYNWNNNGYYEWKPEDVRLDEDKYEEIEIGGKRYTLISAPGSSDGRYYWGCIGVKVETL